MIDGAYRPSVDEILDSTLHELNRACGALSKAASRLWPGGPWPIGSPLTPAQSEAQTVTLGAIDDAKTAIDRAKGALYDALRPDDPPGP